MARWLSLVVVLGVLLLTLPSQVASAQDGPVLGRVNPNCSPQSLENGTWEGVCSPVPLNDLILMPALSLDRVGEPDGNATPAAGSPTQLGTVPYQTVFVERKAATSLRANTQYMTTYVQEGEFVLDVPLASQGNTNENQVLVRSPRPVQLMAPTGAPYPDEPYVPLQPAQTRDCTTGCVIAAGEAVLLTPGDSATTIAGAFCLWCLIKGTPYGTPEGTATPGVSYEAGALVSYVVLPFDANRRETEAFGWAEDWKQPVLPSAQAEKTTRFAWAFNPGSNCRGG